MRPSEWRWPRAGSGDCWTPEAPAGESLFDHHVYVIASDGDLMEGISSEAGVDSEVGTWPDRMATSQATQLKGKAAIANARLAYQAHEEVIASQRWQQLAGLGAQPQRPL